MKFNLKRILYVIFIIVLLLLFILWRAKQKADLANEKFDKQNQNAQEYVNATNKLNSGEFPANVLNKENEVLLHYYGNGNKDHFTHSISQKNGLVTVKFERIKEMQCSEIKGCNCNQISYLFSELSITDFKNTKFVFNVRDPKLQDYCSIDLYSCKTDSDCGKVNLDCCGNSSFIAVNKNYHYHASKQFCPVMPNACPEGFSEDWTWKAPIKCVLGKCELIKLEKGATGKSKSLLEHISDAQVVSL